MPRRALLAGAALALASLPASAVALMYATTGNAPMAVVSGSMEPAYSVGDLLMIRDVGPSGPKVGDVVLYSRPEQLPVTHRVTEVREHFLTTQGDANSVADAPIAIDRVQGAVAGHIPYAGMLNALFHKAGIDRAGQGLVLGVLTASASVLVLSARRMARTIAAQPDGDVVELPRREQEARAA